MSQPTLTPDQIDTLARQYFGNALEADNALRVHAHPGKSLYAGGDDGIDPVEADLDVLDWLESEFREAIAYHDFHRVQADVERLLTEVGLPVDRKTEPFKRLALALLRANVERLRIAKARRVGDYGVEPADPLFRFQPSPVPVASQPDPALSSLPLLDLIAAYVQTREQDRRWTADTKRKTLPKLIRFAETLDNKPVDTVSRDDIRTWRQSLEESELSNNTIRLHFKTVAAVFNWAKTEKRATLDNPTKGLMPPEDDPVRDAFTSEELKKLFHSPLYTGHWRADRRERPGKVLLKDFKYWFPLIGLHTGMRVEEIAKLRTEDVRQEDGIWCFDIKKAKTKAGERLVPIHPRLITLGFLDHVAAVKEERLWPELVADAEGDYSGKFCKWFPWYRRVIGIDREGLVFHSFRHLFTSYLLNVVGVEERMVSFLVGHKVKSMTGGRYGNKLITPRMKLDLFKEADFGVDLSHLMGS
ncbi:site-specific integrase [Novispirillum itersonii]|uniref:site-specific integrase n=1 Tax=Novispirillum itersonii TaxID=189 RepID=UPI00146A7828|nr:site-specific integrase [Novispirillum itersonii]